MHAGKDFFALIFLNFFSSYKHQKLTSNSFFNVLRSTHNSILVVMIAFLAFKLVRELHIHMHLATKSCLGYVGPDVKRSIKQLFIHLRCYLLKNSIEHLLRMELDVCF